MGYVDKEAVSLP